MPAITRARLAHRPSSVLYLDVDNFKQLNDRYGHDFGDCVLNRVADNLRSVCGDDAIIARFGGDEFVILFPGSELAVVRDTALRIQQLAHDRNAGEEDAIATVSIGIAECDSNEILPDTIRRADLALLQAKASGRDRVQIAQSVSTSNQDGDLPETWEVLEPPRFSTTSSSGNF
ncbi:MAG: GGDEF domain-containing protein [Thermomicrobiales bacterium]